MAYLQRRKIIGIVLCILGIILIVFSQHYPEAAWWVWCLLIIGILMALSGAWLLRSMGEAKKMVEHNNKARRYHALLDTGQRITVDLTKCEVRENSYVEEVMIDSDNDTFTDLLIGTNIPHHSRMEKVNFIQSVIVYHHEENGKKERFVSPVIQKEKITLLFLLDMQKTTTLYVDKNDRSIYFFELGFLK